jgi:hypothetical protein
MMGFSPGADRLVDHDPILGRPAIERGHIAIDQASAHAIGK